VGITNQRINETKIIQQNILFSDIFASFPANYNVQENGSGAQSLNRVFNGVYLGGNEQDITEIDLALIIQ
jgi:hypothetical protein